MGDGPKVVGQLDPRLRGRRTHICISCDFPIAVYGRCAPCLHAYCLTCAAEMSVCMICRTPITKLERIPGESGLFISPATLQGFRSEADLAKHAQQLLGQIQRLGSMDGPPPRLDRSPPRMQPPPQHHHPHPSMMPPQQQQQQQQHRPPPPRGPPPPHLMPSMHDGGGFRPGMPPQMHGGPPGMGQGTGQVVGQGVGQGMGQGMGQVMGQGMGMGQVMGPRPPMRPPQHMRF